MKYKIPYSIFALLTLVNINISNAQTFTGPRKIELLFENSFSDTTANANGDFFSFSPKVKATAILLLNDTTDIAEIHVRLGLSAGDSSLLNKTFIYDSSGIFADGSSYNRNGLVVHLGLGTFENSLDKYYAEAWLENSLGIHSLSVVRSR